MEAQENAGETQALPAYVTTNMDKYFYQLYKVMMYHYRNSREEEAFQLAEQMLLDLELPLLFRVRCHMVLGTNTNGTFYLPHANEAVRLLNEDCRAVVDKAEFPVKEYEEALRLQKLANKTALRRTAEAEATTERESEEATDTLSQLNLPKMSAADRLAIREALQFAGGRPTPPASRTTSRTTTGEGLHNRPQVAAPPSPASKTTSRTTTGEGLHNRPQDAAPPSSASKTTRPQLASLQIPLANSSSSVAAPTPRTQLATGLGGLNFGDVSPNLQPDSQGASGATEGLHDQSAGFHGGYAAQDMLGESDMLDAREDEEEDNDGDDDVDMAEG